MATNSKPTTSFYINYGSLNPTVAQRALAPALIAPRYRLHRTSFNNAKLTDFPTSSGDTFGWPSKTSGSVVDIASAKLIAKDMFLAVNSDAMSGTVGDARISESTSTNAITMVDTVRPVDNTSASELGGYAVKVGDQVIVSSDGTQTTATIVSILPTMTEETVTQAAIGDAPLTGITVGDTFSGSADAAYLVTVAEIVEEDVSGSGSESDSDSGVVTAIRFNISALDGDYGYSEQVEKAVGSTVEVGTFGITFQFDADLLKIGDAYVITGKAPEVSKYNVIYIDQELEQAVGTNVEVTFCTASLSADETVLPSAYWTADSASISLTAPSMFVTIAGKSYEVTSAELYMQYRELLTTDMLELRTNQTTNISDWVGPVDPENPMGMMYAAAGGVDGTFFYLLAVDDTDASTVAGVNYVAQFEGAYAPITYRQNATTQDAVLAVISKYSTPTIAKYKHTWFCSPTGRTKIQYDKDKNGAPLVGSISAGGGWNLTISGSGVDVVAAGVRSGDIAVIVGAYDTDTGKFEETEYEIKRVAGATTLELVEAEVTGVSRVYIKRVLSGGEYAETLAKEASSFNNSRVNFVVSDVLSFAGFEDVEQVYLCAALASMRCALPPHAPMNDLAVPGFTVGNTLKWTDMDYEKMNAGGCWIVYTNTDGVSVTYHQITTRTDGTIAEEDSAVSNGDAIVRQLRIAVSPLASGRSNVSDALLNRLETTLIAELNQISATVYADIYGPQILDYTVNSLEIPEGNKQSVICSADISVPLPLQDGRFTFNLF